MIGFTLVVGLLLSVSGVALAGRGDPKRHIAPADQKRARAMLLRRSDLGPGFKRTPPSKDTDSYCPSDDESHLTLTGDAGAPEWGRSPRRGLFYVTSGASVWQSQADARKWWKLSIRPATQRCAAAQLPGKSPSFSFHRRSFPRVAQRAFEYRVSDVVRTSLGPIPFFVDLVLLKQSRATVILAFGSAKHAPTLAYEQRLAHIVAKRMQKAMQGA